MVGFAACLSLAAMMPPAGTWPSSNTRASIISPWSISAIRVSPMPRSISHSGNRVTGRFQQYSGFGKREADNVGIASGDVADIDLAIALKRIAAGLAVPFAMTGVKVDLIVAQRLHRDHR